MSNNSRPTPSRSQYVNTFLAVGLVVGGGLLGCPRAVRAADETADFVYLDATDLPTDLTRGLSYSVLNRELIRQAFLCAARDDLGLATRDASLREPTPAKPGDARAFHLIVRMESGKGLAIKLQRGPADKRETIWERFGPFPAYNATTTTYLAIVSERHFRAEFADAIKKAGYKGRPVKAAGNAAVPEDAERWLGQLNEVSQFVALRQLHAAMRADGESPKLLMALARAYAQLGVLTEMHWASDAKVFKARALLYAQRAVERDPTAAAPQWNRAFVLALVGLHVKALEALAEADGLAKAAKPPAQRPTEALLAEALCRFDADKLLKVAADDKKYAELAQLLAYLTVEDFSAVHRTLAAGRELLESNPECYRVHDSLAGLGGVSTQHRTTLAGLDLFTRALPKRLAATPGLPAAVDRLLEDGAAEPAVLAALVETGRAVGDRSEPSWAVLGRIAQETRFTQIWRRLDFMHRRWAVPVDEFAMESLPLVAGHPYAPLIESYAQPLPYASAAVLKLLSKVPVDDIDFNRVGFIVAYGQVVPSKNVELQNLSLRFGDDGYYCAQQLLRYLVGPRDRVALARSMYQTCPNAPLARAVLIELDWPAVEKLAEKWRESSDPTVQLALGRHYSTVKKWDDAAACLKKSMELSPDSEVYEVLARAYRAQKNIDGWRETLEASLKEEDTGLNHARVRVEIAREYMSRKDFKAARPYAEAAAETGAQWAMATAAECYEALGEWDAAGQMVRAVSERYPTAWLQWYVWCRRTGHGDGKAADEFTIRELKRLGNRATADHLVIEYCVYQTAEQPEKALQAAEKLAAQRPTPSSYLLLAAIQDVLGKEKERDESWRKVALPEGKNFKELCDLFLRCTAAGAKGKLDLDEVEKVLSGMPEDARSNASFFVGRFLALRGDKKNAAVYLRRRVDAGVNGSDILWALAATILREQLEDETKQP